MITYTHIYIWSLIDHISFSLHFSLDFVSKDFNDENSYVSTSLVLCKHTKILYEDIIRAKNCLMNDILNEFYI